MAAVPVGNGSNPTIAFYTPRHRIARLPCGKSAADEPSGATKLTTEAPRTQEVGKLKVIQLLFQGVGRPIPNSAHFLCASVPLWSRRISRAAVGNRPCSGPRNRGNLSAWTRPPRCNRRRKCAASPGRCAWRACWRWRRGSFSPGSANAPSGPKRFAGCKSRAKCSAAAIGFGPPSTAKPITTSRSAPTGWSSSFPSPPDRSMSNPPGCRRRWRGSWASRS